MKRFILPLLITPSLAFPQMDGEDSADSELGMPPPPSIGGPANSGSADGGPLSKEKKDKLAMASPDEINDKNFPDLIDSFDYNNAEITDVIKAISELTGKNFIIDPAVRGKITIIAPTKISVAEAYRAFLSALAINGYTVVPSGGFLKVKSSRNAQRDNIDTYSGAYFPNSDQMITRIIHLKHISAEQVSRELRILNSKDGELSPYPQTNSLILSDYGSNIERVMKIINQLDVPGFEEKLVVIPIKYAKAKDMAELVNKIVNKDSSSSRSGGGSISAGVPRFGGARPTASGGSGSAYFMVIPDDRTNALIVVGNTSGIDRIRKLLSQLDFKIRLDENGGVYVYYVKNGEAEKIAQTLNGIAKDSKPAASSGAGPGAPPIGPAGVAQSTEVFGGDVKMVADKETNSLIVTASKQDYEVVLNLLSKIDIPRDQVFVEAIIMEMILEDSAKWGVGYFKFDAASKGMIHGGFNGLGDLTSLLSPTGGEGAILPFGSKTMVPITLGGNTVNVPDLMGFINLLKGVGRTNILSTPQIMALDNEDAEISVGEDVAVGYNESVTAAGTSKTPNYKDASLKLKIKPFISPGSDNIRMKIEQKTAQPKTSTPGQLKDTLTIAKREITTIISVPNGDTAVLGGLVKDQEQESVSKVPILGDIPILGWLFKSRTITKSKANLLVFITPKIIRNSEDSSKLLNKKLDQRLGFIKQSGGRDPYGKMIDDLPRRQASDSNRGAKDSTEPIRTHNKMDSEPTIETNNEAEIKVESDLKNEENTQSEDGKVIE
jgi:general secretion pathway protein D